MSTETSRPIRFASKKKKVMTESGYKYKVIIADDDRDVHTVTKMVLGDFRLEGAGIEFFDTYSGEETMRLLKEEKDIAVVILDVVMEQDTSGLQVVEYTRETLQNSMTRIILKTGQPGIAPEERVIVEYDINDYRSKSELTAQKFITTLYTALRNYRDLKKLEDHKRGLEKVIESSSDLYNHDNLSSFFSGLLKQLNSIRNFQNDSFMASADPINQESGFIAYSKEDEFRILSATGKYESCENKFLQEVEHRIPFSQVMEQVENRTFFYRRYEDFFIGYYKGFHGSRNLIYLEGRLNELSEDLIRVFLTNFTFAFDRLFMNRNMMDAMQHIIMMLGETIEYRDGETGFHVRRVSETVRLIAEKSGRDNAFCDEISIASIVHDIGKIAIPDSILQKPGKLTDQEFEKIKDHTRIGHEILNTSSIPTIGMAAEIALGHHEKWNGKGYPAGLKGDEIPWTARVTAIADVYDALANKRYYKEAWSDESIFTYLEEEKGESFDPDLIDLVLENKDALREVQRRYPDIK